MLRTPRNEFFPEISPDGRWVAYVTQEDQREIFIAPFPDASRQRWPVDTGYQNQPVWSRDGSEPYYRASPAATVSSDARIEKIMMAVTVNTDEGLSVGIPQALFEDRYFSADLGRHYDVGPDGQFLMIKTPTTTAPDQQIHILRNWTEELTARVPVS